MKVGLTGATGFVGSHVLSELSGHGHDVTGFVRDAADAERVAERGGTPVVADLYDREALAEQLARLDAAIHTASPGDETSAALDTAVVDAVLGAFDETGKPYLQISGAWIYGDNLAITEDSPVHAPALVAWKQPIEERVLSATGVRGVVIVSSVAYGDGGGAVPGVLLGSPRDQAGNLVILGSGEQHWSTVHAADLADVFRRVLEDDTARGRYVVGNGHRATLAELTDAAAVAAGAPGAVPGSDEEAKARLGEYFAEVLLLDQATTARRASDELGWSASRPTLAEELREGSYLGAGSSEGAS
jgi:nucleoside-diphosphate-sugar epimerase